MRRGASSGEGVVSRLSAKTGGLWDSYKTYGNSSGDAETPEFSSAFMGPGEPRNFMFPELEVRRHDYNAYRNMTLSQDLGRDGVTIKDLRAFADSCEVLRSVIEKCKDYISVLKYDFQLKNEMVRGLKPKEVKEKTESNLNIKKARDFFKKPDGDTRFREWIRMVLEEVLVVDMLCLYPEEFVDGHKIIRQIDADTIIKLINKQGMVPKNGAIAYQQKIKGIITRDFTREELLVYHRNPRIHKIYGFSPVEQIINTIKTALNRSKFQLNYYTEGNIPDMLMRVTKEWTDEQIAKYQVYFDLMMSGDLARRRKITFIPEGMDPFVPQKDVLQDEFDEWLARVICHCFSVSPNGFIKNLNRAIGESSRQQSDEEGAFARRDTLKDICDMLLEDVLGIPDVEITWIPNVSQDSLKQAEVDSIHVQHGIRSRDEVRESLGLPPIGIGCTVTTSHGVVALEEGDEDHTELSQTALTNTLIDGDIPVEENSKEEKPVVAENPSTK